MRLCVRADFRDLHAKIRGKAMITYSRYLFLLAAALLTGCSKDPEPAAIAPAEAKPAPEVFKVKFETSKGDFIVQVNRQWAPLGADRFYQLVQSGFFEQARFFRVIPGFMAQFGIHADPELPLCGERR
jgi:Cyclophilin type peptidyl-prolyl cis-trans isomerase/CLD